jgi:hypothetical protein
LAGLAPKNLQKKTISNEKNAFGMLTSVRAAIDAQSQSTASGKARPGNPAGD